VAKVKELVLNGVEATWLDDTEKAAMAAEFSAELDRLAEELEPGELPA
jgi:adenosine deaminase